MGKKNRHIISLSTKLICSLFCCCCWFFRYIYMFKKDEDEELMADGDWRNWPHSNYESLFGAYVASKIKYC